MSRVNGSTLRTAALAAGLLCGWLALAGCTPEGFGFKLPPGELAQGRTAFVSLGCHDCHSVADIERAADSDTDIDLRLGGPVTRVKNYGELVTSVINPSHRIARPYPPQPVDVDGESRMPSYNSIMTVQQLVDVVTFLESEYELRAPPSYL